MVGRGNGSSFVERYCVRRLSFFNNHYYEECIIGMFNSEGFETLIPDANCFAVFIALFPGAEKEILKVLLTNNAALIKFISGSGYNRAHQFLEKYPECSKTMKSEVLPAIMNDTTKFINFFVNAKDLLDFLEKYPDYKPSILNEIFKDSKRIKHIFKNQGDVDLVAQSFPEETANIQCIFDLYSPGGVAAFLHEAIDKGNAHNICLINQELMKCHAPIEFLGGIWELIGIIDNNKEVLEKKAEEFKSSISQLRHTLAEMKFPTLVSLCAKSIKKFLADESVKALDMTSRMHPQQVELVRAYDDEKEMDKVFKY